MGSNLVSNVLSAMKTKNIRSVVGWTDSTVKHVMTKQNPADIGSRGSLMSSVVGRPFLVNS